MVGGIVIEAPTGGRAVVALESLPEWIARGFREVGPVADPGAEGIVTREEWAATLAARTRPATAPAKAKTTTSSNDAKKG